MAVIKYFQNIKQAKKINSDKVFIIHFPVYFMFDWQKRTWTCGPAALRISLNQLGIRKTEKHLARLLKTTKFSGTKNKNFIKVARYYNLKYIYKKNSSLNEIKKLLDEKYKIVVCYFSRINNSGHFAAVRKITKAYIYLLDPSLGPKTRYKKSYFTKIWIGQYDKEKRWFIALKKKKSKQ